MDALVLHGYNSSTGTDKLITCRPDVFKIYNPVTGVWDNVTSPTVGSPNLMSSTNFLDYAFFSNYVTNYTYNGSWSTSTNVADMPLCKYLENLDLRVYGGYVKIRGNAFASRVVYSDLPKNNGVVWGFETGSDLAQTASSAVITSAGSLFITRNIKIGDPIFIESGTNAGEYTVKSIDSETQLTLTKTLANTQTNCNFWVGSNWFDVKTNDGDFLTGFGKNSNELLIFKRNSLHRYNTTAKYLRQVKQVKGTTSPRSIVNKDEFTYYFYPGEGILRYNGTTSQAISLGLDDIIDGIPTSMYTEVVGWATNGFVEFYIGDVTLRDGDTLSHCVISFDTSSEVWRTRSLPFGIVNKTVWYQDNVPSTYLINDIGQVIKVDDGYSYAGLPIHFRLEDRCIFPVGMDTLVDHQRIKFFIENGLDVHVSYKLIYKPDKDDSTKWRNDTGWKPLKGKIDADKVEYIFQQDKEHRSCGVKFLFIESSTNKSFLIEPYVLYYSNPGLV